MNYDAAGRISGLTSGPHHFSYTRHPDSALLADTSFSHNGSERLKTTRTFDQLNRLQAITHQRTAVIAGVAVSSNYGYSPNDANQRTAMTQPNGQTWNWGNDSLGQSRRPGAAEIDHAAAWPRRGEGALGRRLNQYITITHPAQAVASGEAQESGTVTVNGQPTTRLGPYFHKTLKRIGCYSVMSFTHLLVGCSWRDTLRRDQIFQEYGVSESVIAHATPEKRLQMKTQHRQGDDASEPAENK